MNNDLGISAFYIGKSVNRLFPEWTRDFIRKNLKNIKKVNT